MATAWKKDPRNAIPDQRSGLRILIVEDIDDCAVSTAMLLRLYGHDVTIARNGPDALDAARAERPDVVLLDLGLPGMSGYEVARKLRSDGLTRPAFLIAVTGFGQEKDRERSADAGIDLHLLKPVAPAELIQILSNLKKHIRLPFADDAQDQGATE